MDEKTLDEIIKLIETGKMPDWWTRYAETLAYNLQVHTKGFMFDKITGLFPHEHPDSRRHCIDSFEPITKGSIWKAINNIIRVFNNSSYNIQISEKTKQAIEKYQENEGSLFSQFLEDWIRKAVAEDPNGICICYPPEYTNDLYRFVCHSEIVLPPTDELLIILSEEESKYEIEFQDIFYDREVFRDDELEGKYNVRQIIRKTYNRRLKKKFLTKVFHVFTKTHFIKVYKKDEKDTDYLYEWIKYQKPLPTLPYFENGGVEVEDDIYESFIQPFLPFGNLALLAHRNQRAVELMFYYPRMSEVQQECDVCKGQGFEYVGEDKEKHECHKCHGSKFITIQSPYKVYRKTPDSFDTDNKVFSTPSVEFYSPDVGILKLVQEQWKGYLEQGEEAVFVQQKVKTGNVEAYKSKEMDREGLFSWLSNISKVYFNNFQMFLQYLENYVNASPIKVNVERPYSFAILTESEAFEALTIMLTSDAPVLLKASQVDNFVNKFVSESSPVKRALIILKKYDLLLYYADKDIENLRATGSISGKMVTLHTLAYPVLIKMYEMDQTLFDLEDDQIIEKLSAEVDKFDTSTDLKTSLINQLNESTANPTPNGP